MSVVVSDREFYGSSHMPETDGTLCGGTVDFTRRVSFFDLSPQGTVDAISSSTSDTATKLAYRGRDNTGQTVDQTITLNGQSWVLGVQSYERLLHGAVSGASANGPLANPGGTAPVGDVALAGHACVVPPGSVTNDFTISTARAGSANGNGTLPALFNLAAGDGADVQPGQIVWIQGATGAGQLRRIVAATGFGTDVVAVNRDWDTIPDTSSAYKVLEGMLFESEPNKVTSIVRLFSGSAANAVGPDAVFFEKVFVVNNNAATALTGVSAEVLDENPPLPGGDTALDCAWAPILNDAETILSRQTPPSVGFSEQPVAVALPGAGNLPPGAAPNAAGAAGLWLRLTIPAGASAYSGSADLAINGSTV